MLKACKTNLFTACAHNKNHSTCLLVNALKDHLIPLQSISNVTSQWHHEDTVVLFGFIIADFKIIIITSVTKSHQNGDIYALLCTYTVNLNSLLNTYSFQLVQSIYNHLCLRHTPSRPAPYVCLGEVSAFSYKWELH